MQHHPRVYISYAQVLRLSFLEFYTKPDVFRQKHNSSISELGDQIDNLNKLKAKTEKERNGIALELEDMQNMMTNDQNERMALEKQVNTITM